MRTLSLVLLALPVLFARATPALAAPSPCHNLDPPVSIKAGADRAITARDLVTLRDIGPDATMFLDQSPIGVSPDGRRIAFELQQADPDHNRTCLGLYVLDLESGRPPRAIDRGGELVRFNFTRGPLADYPSGDAKLIVPRWSPDGQWIATLKSIGGPVQVWLARADGSDAHVLTHSVVDVEEFAWTADGRGIVAASRPDLVAQREAIEREALGGWHYDDRWSPVASNHPWPSEPLSIDYRTTDILSGVDRPATEAESRLVRLPLDAAPGTSRDVPLVRGNAQAWTAPDDPTLIPSDERLHVRIAGRDIPCPDAACRGTFRDLWWNGDELLFLRVEGWARSEFGLYVWKPGYGAPRRTLLTPDLLLGCQPVGGRLLCAEESSTAPRHLVWLDPHNGRRRLLLDPNPEYEHIRLGSVERLHWSNDRGLPVFADLILPPGYRGDQRLPAILVQYQTQGFLRGGTDDEFPIQLFAAHGFAVLSLQRPRNISSLTPVRSHEEKVRIDRDGWNDKRSILSAITSGFALLDRRGLIDPTRLGITGLSDGATTAQFALVNTSLFHAASLVACCEDPKTLIPLMGPFGDRDLSSWRYPRYTDPADRFWSPYSIAANADRITAPLLLQMADDEYLAALETMTSLAERHKPVDLYVFPDEHHMKWQPAHRLAVYNRNLDWFDFWLNGHEDPDPLKAGQYRRWEAMKASAGPDGGRGP